MEFKVGKWYRCIDMYIWYFRYVKGNENKVYFNEYFSSDSKPPYQNMGSLQYLNNINDIVEVSEDEIRKYLPKDYKFEKKTYNYYY